MGEVTSIGVAGKDRGAELRGNEGTSTPEGFECCLEWQKIKPKPGNYTYFRDTRRKR
jgi:hypothetical protein